MPTIKQAALACIAVSPGTVLILNSLSNNAGSLRGGRRLQFSANQLPDVNPDQAQQALSNMGNNINPAGGQAHQAFSNGMDYTRGAMHKANNLGQYSPEKSLNHVLPTGFQAILPLLQAIFGVLYYCMVVSNYPYWNGPTPMSCELQNEMAPTATCKTSPQNCCLAWFCPQARAAHTFDRTGTLDYWCGLIAMFFCPFCTLCYANACTDLNPKLGGQPQNPIMSAACTWLCSCCTIAQDAESLDAATGSASRLPAA